MLMPLCFRHEDPLDLPHGPRRTSDAQGHEALGGRHPLREEGRAWRRLKLLHIHGAQ